MSLLNAVKKDLLRSLNSGVPALRIDTPILQCRDSLWYEGAGSKFEQQGGQLGNGFGVCAGEALAPTTSKHVINSDVDRIVCCYQQSV